eukprot:9565911-Alexandrium_andersonii.AAC.1
MGIPGLKAGQAPQPSWMELLSMPRQIAEWSSPGHGFRQQVLSEPRPRRRLFGPLTTLRPQPRPVGRWRLARFQHP